MHKILITTFHLTMLMDLRFIKKVLILSCQPLFQDGTTAVHSEVVIQEVNSLDILNRPPSPCTCRCYTIHEAVLNLSLGYISLTLLYIQEMKRETCSQILSALDDISKIIQQKYSDSSTSTGEGLFVYTVDQV